MWACMPDKFSKLQTFPNQFFFRLRARHGFQSSERVRRGCLPDRTHVPAGAAPTSRLPLQDRRPIVPLRGQKYFHIFQLGVLVTIIPWTKPIEHYKSPEPSKQKKYSKKTSNLETNRSLEIFRTCQTLQISQARHTLQIVCHVSNIY